MLWIFALYFTQAKAQSTNNPCDRTLYPTVTGWEETWTAVPPANWDYNQTSETVSVVGTPTTTPCGYKSAQIYEDNNPGFCLTIPNSRDRMVQVMLEAEEDSQIICLKTAAPSTNPMAAGALDPICGVGRLRACFPAESSFYTSNNLQVYVYSDPPTAEFTFWYKADHSDYTRQDVPAASSATDNVDMWCQMISGTSQTLWPQDCTEMDFETPPPREDNDVNSAYRFVPNVFWFLFLAFY